MWATCPAHLVILLLIVLIIYDDMININNCLIMQFSPSSCYLPHYAVLHHLPVTHLIMQFYSIFLLLPILGRNILLSSVPSDTSLSLCSFLKRDQVSCPYKTTGRIILLYILIFRFLDGKLKDSELIGSKHSLHIMCS